MRESRRSGAMNVRVLHSPPPNELPAKNDDGAVRIASRREEFEAAYRLVYRSYLLHGYVCPSAAEIVYHPAFGLEVSRTLIFQQSAGEIAGTLSVVGDNSWGLQLEAIFPREVASLRAAGKRLAEVTCLAVDRKLTRLPDGFFQLTRFLFQYACWRDYDELLLAIHPRHFSFYQRFFHIHRFAQCRPHPACNDHPAVGCRINVNEVTRAVDPLVLDWYTADKIPSAAFAKAKMPADDNAHFCRRIGARPMEQQPPRRAA